MKLKKITVLALFSLMLILASFKPPMYTRYNVTFTNKYWNNMHLQIRVGNNSSPENNPIVYDRNLSRNGSYSVPYEVFCWYRRDANPDRPDGVHFTNWTSTGCFSNSACTVDNP